LFFPRPPLFCPPPPLGRKAAPQTFFHSKPFISNFCPPPLFSLCSDSDPPLRRNRPQILLPPGRHLFLLSARKTCRFFFFPPPPTNFFFAYPLCPMEVFPNCHCTPSFLNGFPPHLCSICFPIDELCPRLADYGHSTNVHSSRYPFSWWSVSLPQLRPWDYSKRNLGSDSFFFFFVYAPWVTCGWASNLFYFVRFHEPFSPFFPEPFKPIPFLDVLVLPPPPPQPSQPYFFTFLRGSLKSN